VGHLLDGKYQIEKLLGVGGMGRVYKATQVNLDKTICVKVLRSNMMQDDTLVRRFQREAKAASRLNHPNSITVIDFGQAKENGSLYLAMEYVPGKDLGKIIQEEFPLGERRIVHIMDQVLSALADAHAVGIVHRDLKPENIMVTDLRGTKDFVKVLDFGIAKIQESANEPGLTQVGMVCGTPEYMSPEQARGEELDARSDLYATGVILYQIVTGQLPFSAPTAMGIVTKHLTEQPVPPSQLLLPGSQISGALEAVVLKAMGKDRQGRQATALAFQQELNAVLNPKVAPAQEAPEGNNLFDLSPLSKKTVSQEAAVDDPILYPKTPKKKSNKGLLVALLLLLIAGVGVGAYFLFRVDSIQHGDVTDFSVKNDGGSISVATEDSKSDPLAQDSRVQDASSGVLAKKDEALPAQGPKRPADLAPKEGAERNPGFDVGIENQPVSISEIARTHFVAGKEFHARKEYLKAIKSFQRAIKISPGFAEAYKALGMCFMVKGDFDRAKKYYQKYLEKAPTAEDREEIQELISDF
jgi:serine/threonine protein kinase